MFVVVPRQHKSEWDQCYSGLCFCVFAYTLQLLSVVAVGRDVHVGLTQSLQVSPLVGGLRPMASFTGGDAAEVASYV